MYIDRRRGAQRIRPPHSVRAELFDKESILAHGVLVNLSESGARLITNVGVASGRLVQLRLRPSREDELVTRSLIVWNAEGVELPQDLVGVRHGLRFASSPLGFARIHQLLQRFGWRPLKGRSSFDTLVDPDIEALFDDQIVLDSFQDFCNSILPYTERLVHKLRFGRL
jgi:hypothetical protein